MGLLSVRLLDEPDWYLIRSIMDGFLWGRDQEFKLTVGSHQSIGMV